MPVNSPRHFFDAYVRRSYEEWLKAPVEVARRAHTTATMALIFSVGGMLAAIAAAVLAFLALRGATISW